MNKRPKHIYWFASYNLEGASTRYRVSYPMEMLRNEYDIACDFVYPTRNIQGVFKFIVIYLSVLFARKSDSLIVFQKICTNHLYANLLKLLVLTRPSNTVYDIDDAEYIRQDIKTLHFFLRKCETVCVGSQALRDYCKDFNNNIVLLTSPVLDHEVRKEKRNEIINIGWVGDMGCGISRFKDFSHKTSMFEILFPQLAQIERPIVFTLIGVKNERDFQEIHDYFEESSNIKVNILQDLDWVDDEWVYTEIKKFDIGVSPLTNHIFNVSKSAFKAKQYMSVGIPTIASDIGENRRFVKDGLNGFLCQNHQEFKIAIDKIMNMSYEEYFRLSENALKTKQDYSMRNYCESLIDLFSRRAMAAMNVK